MDKIIATQDGSHSIFSEQFGVSYHSKYGAIQETKHVFINAGLRLKAVVQRDIAILDIGFGTGLNALMTLLEADKRNLQIDYVAYEAFPISDEQARILNYPTVLDLKPDYTAAFQQMHFSDWEILHQLTDNFSFTKHLAVFDEVDYQNKFDVVYFDAFAPNSQPELWERPIMERMYNALKPDGALVTYCAKGSVKRTMKALGFTIEKLQGPPGKREMTRAIK
ncbi:MAG: tRNA (5-methylaminomethyl-2-thiouridine)(34)-methyltransferase MnmD [Saprospiraceae bacterium]